MTSKPKQQSDHEKLPRFPKKKFTWLPKGKDWIDLASALLLPIIGGIWVYLQSQAEQNKQYDIKLESYFTSLQSLENDILQYDLRISENSLLSQGETSEKAGEINGTQARKREEAEKTIQSLALAKTLIVLQELDPIRRGAVIEHLYIMGLLPGKHTDYDSSAKEFSCDAWRKDEQSNKPLIPFEQVPLIDRDRHGNLENFDLSKSSYLPGIKFEQLGLKKFNFKGANLDCSSFMGSVITDANFENGLLRGANFSEAFLRRVDFSGSWLEEANFSGVRISEGVSFNHSILDNAIIFGTDLRGAKNLTKEQLEGKNPPLLCKAKLPPAISAIDSNRDCKQIPQALVDRYPDQFKTVEDAQKYMDKP